MRYLRHGLLVVGYIIATGVLQQVAAQPSRQNPGEVAPDWLVWRVYYDSLEFYDKQSPQGVQDLLTQQVGLTIDEAVVLRTAGSNYLRELAQIDDRARAEVKARFQSEDGPNPLPQPPPSVLRGKAPPPIDLIGSRAPAGKNLREALLADGLIARTENRRVATFRTHRTELARTLGPTKLAALEELIRTQVAPNVKVVSFVPPVPSAGRAGVRVNDQSPE
jgi:hypothetical protein